MAYSELPWRPYVGYQAWSWTTLRRGNVFYYVYKRFLFLSRFYVFKRFYSYLNVLYVYEKMLYCCSESSVPVRVWTLDLTRARIWTQILDWIWARILARMHGAFSAIAERRVHSFLLVNMHKVAKHLINAITSGPQFSSIRRFLAVWQ